MKSVINIINKKLTKEYKQSMKSFLQDQFAIEIRRAERRNINAWNILLNELKKRCNIDIESIAKQKGITIREAIEDSNMLINSILILRGIGESLWTYYE